MRATTLASIALLPSLFLDSAAFAQPKLVPIVQSPAVVDMTVPTGAVVVFEFDRAIRRIDKPTSPYFRFLTPSGPNEIRLEIADNAHNATIKPVVDIGTKYIATLDIRASQTEPHTTRAVKLFWVNHTASSKLMKSLFRAQVNELKAKLDAMTAQWTAAVAERDSATTLLKLEQERVRALEQGHAELAAENTKLGKHASHYAELSLLRQFDGKHSMITLMKSADDCRGTDVMLCGLEWTRLHDKGVLRFVVYNPTLRDLDVSQVFALRRGGDNVAGAAILGETTLEDGTTGTIRPMQRVHASVIVREPHQVGEAIQLAIAGANRSPIASRHVSLRVIDLRPQNGEGRVTIRVQPSIGAVWLANPVDDKELDAATLMGLGVRVSYGLHTKFTVDAELAGIQSNDAAFSDVSYEGTTGDMLRSTKGARLLFGGALRLGEKYQPFFRLGVGAQVVDHDVRFTSGQNTTTGPGDGIAFAMLGWFGSGLDIQLGKHWTLGAGLQAIAQTSGSTSIEGGVQLGYGWGGYVRD